MLCSTGTWHGTHGVTPLDGLLCMGVRSSDVELALQKGLSLYALYQLYNGIRFTSHPNIMMPSIVFDWKAFDSIHIILMSEDRLCQLQGFRLPWVTHDLEMQSTKSMNQ